MIQIKKSMVDKILFEIENNKVPTTSSIAEGVGISRTTATKYMSELENRGVVCREYAGPANIWKLTGEKPTNLSQDETYGKILEIIDCGGVGCIYPKTSTYGKSILKREIKSEPPTIEYQCSLGNKKCRELRNYAAQQKIVDLLNKT